MRGMRIFSTFILLMAVVMVTALPVSSEISNRVVALVNSEVITLHELNSKIKELTGAEPAEIEARDKEGYIELRRKVLDLLIDEKIAQDKIREVGIDITQNEVDATVERIKERNHWTHEDLLAGLDNQGITYEQYLKNLKKEMEQMRLVDFEVKAKIIVREEDVKKYYDDHAGEFRSNEKIRIAIILLANRNPSEPLPASLSEKAEEILSELKAGVDFGELAKKYSDGPGAQEGGDLGFINTTQLDQNLREIILSMAVGDVSGPLVSPIGIQILKVLEKQEMGVKTIEEVKDSIYDILYKEEINKRYSSWIKGLREQAYIKVIF